MNFEAGSVNSNPEVNPAVENELMANEKAAKLNELRAMWQGKQSGESAINVLDGEARDIDRLRSAITSGFSKFQ